MTEADWQQSNTAYLASQLAWVKARLTALAEPQSEAKRKPAPDRPAMVARKKKEGGQFVPALVHLSERLGLSAFEESILLLCAAAALDTGSGALCAAANGEKGKPYPTFALALRLFDDPDWAALAPAGGLRHWRLIEIHQAAGEPLISAALRADERIINYLKGLNHLDDRVESWISPLTPASADTLPPSHVALCEDVQSSLLAEESATQNAVVQLLGPHGATKREIVITVARSFGRATWRLSTAALSDLGGELDQFARLLHRETMLLGAVLFIDAEDEAVGAAAPAPLGRLLSRLSGVIIFLAVRDPLQGIDSPGILISVDRPTIAEQRAAWLRFFGPKQERAANELAGQFNLDVPAIENIAARAKIAEGGSMDIKTICWRAARVAARPRVQGLAERIDARATWADIVLPTQQLSLLEELAAQVEHQWVVNEQWGFASRSNRGLGIGALFCGSSGTGKTMAAEVIAREVDLDLYRIDLASVVSKYIGETEKNLRRLFDAFDDGGAILFFDEADALFGKRSEVKDSHDRYANIEINYLLQRMESYRGLVILATNRRSAMDQAFMRRLRFIVEFPYPGVVEREKIWERAFPMQVPRDDIDWKRLARLGLSGGNIQSVALNAAFRAAVDAGGKVSMKLILESARAELVKLDLPVNEADFRSEPELRRSA